MRCWIGVVSREHALRGKSGNYAQVCHGKGGPLKRMKPGDGFIFYSSKEKFQGKELCQKFTAIGKVMGDDVYQFEMSPDFKPFRIDINFDKSATETSILPLIQDLSFIRNKKSWGGVFRFGHVEIPKEDFELIAEKMNYQFEEVADKKKDSEKSNKATQVDAKQKKEGAETTQKGKIAKKTEESRTFLSSFQASKKRAASPKSSWPSLTAAAASTSAAASSLTSAASTSSPWAGAKRKTAKRLKS